MQLIYTIHTTDDCATTVQHQIPQTSVHRRIKQSIKYVKPMIDSTDELIQSSGSTVLVCDISHSTSSLLQRRKYILQRIQSMPSRTRSISKINISNSSVDELDINTYLVA